MGFFFASEATPGTGGLLLNIFEVNALHNIAHLLIGIALIVAARAGDRQARSANFAVGAVYLLLGLVGWFIDEGGIDFLALNVADHFLHLASAAVLIGVSRADRANSTRTA